MRNKAVDAFLPTLKFVSNRSVKNKMLKKLDDVVFSNDDIVFVNEDSDNVTFFRDDMGLIVIYLNKINLDDDNFDDDDSETIIYVRLMSWCQGYKQRKACKEDISKDLMLNGIQQDGEIGTCQKMKKKKNRTAFD